MTYLNMQFYEVDSHHILRPPWHNYICIFLGWDAKLLKSWLDQRCVLVKDMVKVSPTLFNVSYNSPEMLIYDL